MSELRYWPFKKKCKLIFSQDIVRTSELNTENEFMDISLFHHGAPFSDLRPCFH